jgi:hypothetical protein
MTMDIHIPKYSHGCRNLDVRCTRRMMMGRLLSVLMGKDISLWKIKTPKHTFARWTGVDSTP